MKKILLLILFVFALFTSCKKSAPIKPVDHLTQLQTNILGNWYYNSLDLGYYAMGVDVYDEVANPTDLRSEPYFIFNKDLTGTYVGAGDNGQNVQFTYAVTSQNGADSLILSGGVIGRDGIQLTGNTQMELSSSVQDSVKVLNVSGKVVMTTMTKFAATLIRVPVN